MVNIPIFILYFYFCIFKMVQSDIINNPIQTDIKHNALNYYINGRYKSILPKFSEFK